jgi:pantoate--beta-alanine ligase
MVLSILKTPSELSAACDRARSDSRRVGFVPTMGALHDGHLDLVREAKKRADFVVCSIFVNPTQFGPNEDFARYPRDLDGDVRKLAEAGCDLVFAPEPDAMYPKGEQTRVRVARLTDHLCGPHRPGHFEGVTTVVAKLFAIVGPSVAVFGEKDFQQLAVIRRMTTDLFFRVEVVGHPIVREADGLAMSSRNAYLSREEREKALALSRGLDDARAAWARGVREVASLRNLALAPVETVATSIDYVTVADAETIQPFADETRLPVNGRALVAIAARIGKTRLIDNTVLGDR